MTQDGDAARLPTLDAIRGFAVMGILLLNIVDFAMPNYAYVDPHYYGGATGANWWAWALNFVLAEGKMRGLFTMMFGASTMLVAERALRNREGPVQVHYARMAVLFVIGMIHAYLIWSGDILVLYSLCGAIVFVAWRWGTRTLLAAAIILMALKLAIGLEAYVAAKRFEAAATAPAATTQLRRQWQEWRDSAAPPRQTAADDLAAYRGNFASVQAARQTFTIFIQTDINIDMLPDTLALMLIGMALFRSGFFSGRWSRRRYWQVIAAGGLCVPLYLPLVALLTTTQFAPQSLLLTDALHLTLLRPFLAFAYAAVIILFVQSGRVRWFADRLAATGRMAFTNYLGTSIICTLLFYGYGLGWYGYLERWQLYPVVLGIWIAMLLCSKPWLDRFAYGPLEWAWRSAARLEIQPIRRQAAK